MSKELEALNGLFDLVHCQDSFEKAQKYFDIIEQALQRLEAIDNANPGEALECLEKLTLLTCNIEWYKDNINIIKQALIKAEKSLKALEIIKRFIWIEDGKLKCGRYADIEIELEEEDFESKEELDLLKEVLKC